MAVVEELAAVHFPTLAREGVIYLDSGATSQTPQSVIDAMADYYAAHRASVHRGVYPLAAEATALYDGARERVASWLGAEPRGTVFTKNATEAVNLVANAWGRTHLGPGDVVLLTEMEHHSNIVPWQLVAQATGATVDHLGVDDEGRLSLDELDAKLAAGNVKMVAVVHVSNVLGTINPVAEIARRAHAAGATVLVDGAQAVPQIPVDVREVDADFYVWTGHKAYGPTGIGVLHGRLSLMEELPPFLGGGQMISLVSWDGTTFAQTPAKFEAGTPPIAEAIGLGAAVDLLAAIGMDAVREHESAIVAYALDRLADVPGLEIHGPPAADARGALVSFALDCAHPHDVAEILGRTGVCVRAGHHCAQPLMKRLGVGATTRASFAIHNTTADVDKLIDGLDEVRRIFA